MVEHNKIPSHKQLLELKAALNVMELPEWKDAEKEMEAELERDGSITKAELKHGLEEWEKETGKTITDDEWALVEAGFNYADVNGDGKADKKEWQCIVKGGPCPPKGPNAELMLHEITEEQWEWV